MKGEPFTGPNWKPVRGSEILRKEKLDAEDDAKEEAAKKDAKQRDTWRCRWPEPHTCRKGLEAAHIKDASLGGPMVSGNLIAVCGWIHRRGPESIHGKQLEVRPLTSRGTNGPCAFYRKHYSETRYGEFTWRCVGRERSVGVLESAPSRRLLRMTR